MQKNRRKKKKQLNSYIKYSSIGTQMAIIIVVGAFLGDYIDNQQERSTPLYTIIFSLISVFLSLYYAIKEILKYHEKK